MPGNVSVSGQYADRPLPKLERAMPERPNDYSQYRASRQEDPAEAQRRAASSPQGSQQEQQRQPIVNDSPRIGRNDPCPCGSGKKYKNCHGRGV